ncbi:MAG: EAL domain-containing protein [Candidatus Dormibacteria bacterium]
MRLARGSPDSSTAATLGPDAQIAQARRIAGARWLAVPLAAVEAFTATPHLIGSPHVPLLIAGLIALYNLPATWAGRRGDQAALRIAVATCVADVVVCSAWVFLGANDPKDRSFILYLPVLAEAAVLGRWRGVIPATAAALLSITAAVVGGSLVFGYALGIGDLSFRLGTVVIIAVFAGGFASENHRQSLLVAQRISDSADRRHRVQEVTLLQETARVMASSGTADGVCQALVRCAATLIAIPGSEPPWASMLVRDVDDLVAVAAHGNDDAVSAGTRYRVADHPLLSDLLTHPEQRCGPVHGSALGPLATGPRVQLHRSVLTPVLIGAEVAGILVVSSEGDGAFTPEQLRLCTTVAELGALGLISARQNAALLANASTDPLTGSLNRRSFEVCLGSLPAVAFAVLAVDVDNLKPINDEYGHEAGDLVLRTAARVITEIARSGDVVARVGGDEFAVVLLALEPAEARAVAERMRAAMHGASIPRGRVRISVGLAIGAPGEDAATVWQEADAALIVAKRAGGDGVADAPGATTQMYEPARLSAAIESVIADRAVDVAFQAVVDLGSGEVHGFEALARPHAWGEDSVEPLFRAAHHLGLSRDLDWACRRAAVDALWKLPPEALLFVNVNASALLDPVHDVDQMLLLLTATGTSPSRIVLEITERETIADLARLRTVLAAYREHGFQIALDDVGEGHSTLEVLASAVPDYIKIARSLAIAEHRGARAAIEAAVAFAATTRTAVIAEGVESGEMAARLRDLGVQYGQGYWLARPAADQGSLQVTRIAVPSGYRPAV